MSPIPQRGKRSLTRREHLSGSSDTKWKEKLFEVLEHAYDTGKEAGEVELLHKKPKEMRLRIILQPQDQGTGWKPGMQSALQMAG